MSYIKVITITTFAQHLFIIYYIRIYHIFIYMLLYCLEVLFYFICNYRNHNFIDTRSINPMVSNFCIYF